MSLTPHGPGFSFLDSFQITIPSHEGKGQKWLDPHLPFFTDHFPNHPLMPGVLLIECAAQSAGALWASTLDDDIPPYFILAQVVQFRVMQPVMPDQTIETETKLEKIFGSLAQFEVILRVNQIDVARGRLVLSQAS